MDLIDRSKLHPVDVVEGIDGKDVFTTRSYWTADVANAPTVKAIPIEWIEELADKLIGEDNFEKAMFLLDVRDIWEEENAAD